MCKVPKTWFARFEGLSKAYRPGTRLQFSCPPKHKPSETFRQLGGRIYCQRGGNWNIGILPLGVLCEGMCVQFCSEVMSEFHTSCEAGGIHAICRRRHIRWKCIWRQHSWCRLDCHQPPFGWIANDCLDRPLSCYIVDDVTRPNMAYTEYNLIDFPCKLVVQLASYLHWRIKSKQNLPCANRRLA
jgi:hypothetical protein